MQQLYEFSSCFRVCMCVCEDSGSLNNILKQMFNLWQKVITNRAAAAAEGGGGGEAAGHFAHDI